MVDNINNYEVSITTGQYKLASLEQREMIDWLFGNDSQNCYELYFHWYNILHELGHAIVYFNSTSTVHPVEEEQLVNDFAYAYWKKYGEVDKILKLETIVNKAITKFDIPSTDVNYMMYAKEHWNDEDFFEYNNYGWFQLSSVQAAMKKSYSLEDALSNMCAFSGIVKDGKLSYDISDNLAIEVINDAINLVKEWGLLLPEKIKIEYCDDLTEHACEINERQ